MTLYLFDFDGTLYQKDSMIEFVKFTHQSTLKFFLNNFLFLPFWILWKLRFLTTEESKTFFLKLHFREYDEAYLISRSKSFVDEYKKDLFPGVENYLSSLKGKVCIVTASVDIWMEDIARSMGHDLICTQSVFSNNSFVKVLKNCNYVEKKSRIMHKYNIEDFDKILVFGNSSADYEMYSLGKKHHKFFSSNTVKVV